MRTQDSLGAVKPGNTIFPVNLRKMGSASSSAASSADRVSFHRIHGRSTVSLASNKVAPCIWPDRPMARAAARSICPARATITTSAASNQSSGDCSDQPSCRRLTVKGAVASAQIFWSLSMTMPFKPDVPRSRPMYIGYAAFFGFLPRMIIDKISSSVTSSTRSVPTKRPFFITLARSQSFITL